MPWSLKYLAVAYTVCTLIKLNKGGVGIKKAIFYLLYASISRKRYEIRPELLLMTKDKD